MKKTIRTIFFALAAGAGLFPFNPGAGAAVSLPWSTTYNCADWTSYASPLACDGLEKGNDDYCDPQHLSTHITAGASNPAGAGGKGQRKWLGDGLNNGSGTIKVGLAEKPSELWFRWYMRFQKGFVWGGRGFKVLYLYDTAKPSSDGFMYLMIHNDPRVWTMYTQTGDRRHYYTTGGGWEELFPGGASDGSWHQFEVHIKRETSGTSDDGEWEMWVDGSKVASHKNINYGMAGRNATIDNIKIGSNSGGGANGGCFAVDFDDIAASRTGYIGPLSGDVLTPTPNPPLNLR